MHNKIEIKMENYSAKLTEFNKFIPLLLRSEDLSKMEQDEQKQIKSIYLMFGKSKSWL